jgi:hypothetical protein
MVLSLRLFIFFLIFSGFFSNSNSFILGGSRLSDGCSGNRFSRCSLFTLCRNGGFNRRGGRLRGLNRLGDRRFNRRSRSGRFSGSSRSSFNGSIGRSSSKCGGRRGFKRFSGSFNSGFDGSLDSFSYGFDSSLDSFSYGLDSSLDSFSDSFDRSLDSLSDRFNSSLDRLVVFYDFRLNLFDGVFNRVSRILYILNLEKSKQINR